MTERKHLPRKRFGQHFLKDQSVLRRIVSALGPAASQQILEIGPGLGALTELLLERSEKLVVVELDRDLVKRLEQRYPEDKLRVIQADILNFDLQQAIAPDQATAKLRLIGNLPYNISTPLIFHLLNQVELIQDMLFMLQKEVALRLNARPGNRNYGRLTVMTALRLECEILFEVPPEAFDPPPKVDSTVLRLLPRADPLRPHNPHFFEKMVAAAFAQRRKTLRNSLREFVSAEQFVAADIDPQLRAEALSPEQFVKLADTVC